MKKTIIENVLTLIYILTQVIDHNQNIHVIMSFFKVILRRGNQPNFLRIHTDSSPSVTNRVIFGPYATVSTINHLCV